MDFHKPGPNKRVFAFLLDLLIINGVQLLFSFIKVNINWFIWAAYILLKDSYNGRSIGKICADLQIIDGEGKPVNFTQTIVRNIFMAIPLFPIVEYIVMMQDVQGRRIGDKIAKTKVNDLNPEEKDNMYFWLSFLFMIILFALSYMLYGKSYFNK